MIEFKADCGHTVRAKDEDAGKVVRCAYCGRETQAPDDESQDELDFLFSDLGADGDGATASARSGRSRGASKSGMPFKGAKSVDPFGVVKNMAYIAAVLIVLIFVGKMWVMPLVEELRTESHGVTPPPKPLAGASEGAPDPVDQGRSRGGVGLLNPRLDKRGKEGVYVNPFPPKATIYYRKADDNGSDYSWIDTTANHLDSPPVAIDLKPGEYDIVVTIPLSDPQFRQFSDYWTWRGSIEDEIRSGRQHLASEKAAAVLAPDDAVRVFAHSLGGRHSLGRQYRIIVRDLRWDVLTPMFLPRDDSMRELHDLVDDFVRRAKYGFDETYVKQELAFYGVTAADQQYIEDLLKKIGSVAYRNSEGPEPNVYKMFRINPIDGMLTMELLDESGGRRASRVGGR